jgi:two-component system, OmpR family, response regulator MprA
MRSLVEGNSDQPTAAAVARRILLADDDLMVRAALAAVLESEGYQVDMAQDGREAVEKAMAHSPDLVLLDLNMPNLDGWQAFARLNRSCPLAPVIVVTARPHQYSHAATLGVDAFMEKPLDVPTLLEAIRTLLEESEGQHVQRITNPHFITRLLTPAVC